MNKKQFITLLLVVALVIALGYIAYTLISDYGLRRYAVGMQEGQLVLAADQLGNQQCTFFNGTFIKTIKIQDLCGG